MRELRFNQGFPLYRERLSGMLRCIAAGQATSDESVGAFMGVNPYMVEGVRGWLCKTGLGRGTSKEYTLSPFGSIIAAHDPNLQRPATLWLLHYYLVSQHEERAEVWYRCFNEFLMPGQPFTAAALEDHVFRALEQTPGNKSGVANDTKELIKTYTNAAALGNLGLIVRQNKTEIVSGTPALPDPLITAYVLFDSWPRQFGSVDTVRLSQLVDTPESIGRVFLANNTQVRELIGGMQSMGLLTFADTQHEPVTRHFHDAPIALLERYYRL
ncbi:MAG TPA: DUF4007 family protein [Roseiflexaceae bacterium]|nr:DUF4007 family protein [Roseiflexaceae bacterium]